MRLAPSAGGMTIPPILEPGYHLVELDGDTLTLAVAPTRAYGLIDAFGETNGETRKAFGVAAQIYALPPTPYSSFGDAGSLRDYARALGEAGADAVAVSPSHALYAADPGRSSPYAPSTRLFHNVLMADPGAVFDADFAAIARCDTPDAPLIDWAREGRSKRDALRRLFEALHRRGAARSARGFCPLSRRRRGAAGRACDLRGRCTHILPGASASRAAGRAGRRPIGTRRRLPCRHLPQEHAHEVVFHAFLQWLTERSLGSAQSAAREAGMGIGMIADLAVGMDAGGSHAWSRPDDILQGVSIGAPPDPLGPLGQDWGLTTFSPKALQEHGFAPFIATLRSAMRTAGGMRIDHVMGLSRLWLVPWGMPSTEGVYLQYPLDDMLRIVSLESHRNQAIVIGEDLGTVARRVPRAHRPGRGDGDAGAVVRARG